MAKCAYCGIDSDSPCLPEMDEQEYLELADALGLDPYPTVKGIHEEFDEVLDGTDEPDDSGIDEYDLTNESQRSYFYSSENGGLDELAIIGPAKLYLIPGDTNHYVVTSDGVGQIVPPGWKFAKVYPRLGHEAFQF